MNSFIAGGGQIGQAVAEVISRKDKVITYDRSGGEMPIVQGVDILHICFPYGKKFIENVNNYVNKYKPWHVIIWSTVPIGTTKQIRGAVHSPIEGRHPQLTMSIRSMVRWVGANDKVEAEFFMAYFKDLWLKAKIVDDSNHTEFLKLRSTAKYGINLVWTDYEAQVAEELGMEFGKLQDFDRDYNRLYHNLGMKWAQRYVLRPPKGKIGGHCVRENSFLLDKQFPNDMLKMIQAMKGNNETIS